MLKSCFQGQNIDTQQAFLREFTLIRLDPYCIEAQ